MVPVEREPLSFGSIQLERCCFCKIPTEYWTTLPDRAENKQVACCQDCAKDKEPNQVMSKREWIAMSF